MAEHDVTVFNLHADDAVPDTSVQLAGAAITGLASAVSAQEVTNSETVTLTGAEMSGGAGALAAFDQGTPGTLGFPRVGQFCNGNISAAFVNDPLGEYMREGMALLDAVVVNMNPQLINDVDDGPGGFMSRQNFVNDLKARNSNLLVFDYVTVQVTGNIVTSGSGGLECYQNSGPPGAELHWTAKDYGELQQAGSQDPGGTDLIYYSFVGQPVNDWWARISDGTKKATFGTNYSVNICPSFTQPNPQGQRFPQWHFENVSQALRLDAHATSNGGSGYGPEGVNMFFDVFRVAPKSSRFDFNGDGDADEADTYYNAHNGTHRVAAETLAGGGGVVAANWRLGWRDYFDLHRANYQDIVLIGNTTSWFPNNVEEEGPLSDSNYDVQPEYQLVKGTSYPTLTNNYPRQSCVQGGIVENITSGGSQQVSITGVDSAGVTTASIPGGWQRAYNMHRYLVDICDEPKMVSAQYFIQATEKIGEANGRNAFSYEPHSSTAFHLARWLDALACFDGGYCGAAATQVGSDAGTFITPMHFDHYGTVNTATTGLTKGWLGQPLADPVVISGSGDHRLLWREFEFGGVLGTTSKTNNIAFSVSDIGGAGVFRRIQGVQDPSWDDGSTVNGGFIIPVKDAIFLVRL